MQHVAIRYEIVLSIEAEFAGLSRPRLAIEGNVIGISNGLGANKPLFEVRVNHPRRLRRPGSLWDSPRAGLLGAGGKKRDQPQQPVARVDNPVQARLRETSGFERDLP